MAALVPIPRHPADVTSEWLSAALAADVNEVDVAPIGTGQTGATYRVSATYATQGDLPDTFAIKLPASDEAVRERVALGYRAEVEFYTDVADRVRIPVPRCFYSDISEDGADFVLLLADMAPAVQGDQIAGCAPQQAELAVQALAGLHGPSWCDPVWLGLSAISMPKPGDEAAANGLGDVSVMAADSTIDTLGARMTAQDRDTLRAAMGLVTPWLMAEPTRFALMHGDYRLDNMLFDMHGDPDRSRVTVVDWQTLGVGLPARDLAYFTATSLAPEVRPQIEEDLVGRYHEALLGYGVTDYDADTCWRDYRLGVMQAPLITGLGFAFAASTERGDEMILTMLHRGCRAIRELGTLELINSYRSI
jgi:hypothetical protein